MYSFAGFIKRTAPPTFSDTAITTRHSDTTILSAQSTLGVDILVYWIGKIVRTCAAGGSRVLDFPRERRTSYPLRQALRCAVVSRLYIFFVLYIWHLPQIFWELGHLKFILCLSLNWDGFYNAVLRLRDADGMTNIVGPEQTLCLHCSDVSVSKLSIFTFIFYYNYMQCFTDD